MRLGIVVHGPEAVDSGMTAWFLDRLSRDHEVEATLGGAMGLAAVLDAGMESMVQISQRELVSQAVARLGRVSDTVLLLNWSKSRESGITFGRMVREHLRPPIHVPLMQADRDFYIVWDGEPDDGLVSLLRERGLERVEPPTLGKPQENERVLSGVRPGENIWINGTVIGRATSDRVIVRATGGALSFEGVDVKAHGLEKVRVEDIGTAIIRSGSVRRTRATTRLGPPSAGGRLIMVDHRAEDSIFRARGARAAVTVGDDTTCISSALLARLGVPVIGIVDGDEDGICGDRSAAPGSAIIVLRAGNDDQLGARVRQEVFQGGEEIELDDDLEGLVERIARMAAPSLVEVRRSGENVPEQRPGP